jgi:hypothetical protein
MAIDTASPRSRRALLAAALGAGAATVASALGRPAAVRANDPNDVVLGWANSADTETSITSITEHIDAFRGVASGLGNGVTGVSVNGSGVRGEAEIGVSGESSSTGGTGVLGRSLALSGASYGVRGDSTSTSGVGVSGKATATTGTTIGVRGETLSPGGMGVVGYITNAAGTGYGVHGQTTGAAGYGVFGKATNASGTAHAVRGQADGTGGTGVSGHANAATGATYGVQGRSNSSSGTGVYGYAANIAGSTRGVYGKADSPAGVGVDALSQHIGVRAAVTGSGDATKYAIQASTALPQAYTIHAENTFSTEYHLPVIIARASGPGSTAIRGQVDNDIGGRGLEGIAYDGYGVFGAADKVAVYGRGDAFGGGAGIAGTGVEGEGPTGVHGHVGTVPAPRAKTGVHGVATTDSSSWGVYGQSTTGRGVHGQATTGRGVSGQASTGSAGYFEATNLLTGTALRVIGRVKLDNCAGAATVVAPSNNVVVTPGIDLASTSVVTATLLGSAGGTTTVHRVAVNATANTFTIYLTGNATQNVKVGWHVFG